MSFKDKLLESWKNKHLAEEGHGTHPGDKEEEKEDVKLIKKMVKADSLKKEDISGLTESEVDSVILEVLSKDASAGDWIHDFVHSKNPKFVGKSKAKRRQMALAAYYGKQQEELDPKVRTKDTEAGRQPTKQHDDVGPTADGKSTKVKFTPGPKNEETVLESIGIKKTIKKVGSKLLQKLGHGSDEEMRKDLQKKMGIPQTGKPSMAKQNEEVEQFDESELKTKTAYVPYVYTDKHGSGFGGYDIHYSKEADAHDHVARHGHIENNGKKGWVEKHEITKHPVHGRWVDANHMRRHGNGMHEETEQVEEGWDDMLKSVKDKQGPQPSGGSGIKRGTRYGGGKQTTKPEHDEAEEKKK